MIRTHMESQHKPDLTSHNNEIQAYLLLELDEAVKDGHTKLLQIRIPVDLNLPLEELVFQASSIGIIPAVDRSSGAASSRSRFRGVVKERLVFWNVLDTSLDRVHVLRPCECIVSFWIQSPDGWEKLCPLFLGQLGSETIQGDYTE